jgi:hypothetical protein
MTSVLSVWQYVGITCCFSLEILNFLIWQFTLTRQIDKFKLLFIISDKKCGLIRIPRMTSFNHVLHHVEDCVLSFVVDFSRNINFLLP